MELPDLSNAVCVTGKYDPEIWFSSEHERQAIRLCGTCPNRTACGELGGTEEFGVWGGVPAWRRGHGATPMYELNRRWRGSHRATENERKRRQRRADRAARMTRDSDVNLQRCKQCKTHRPLSDYRTQGNYPDGTPRIWSICENCCRVNVA